VAEQQPGDGEREQGKAAEMGSGGRLGGQGSGDCTLDRRRRFTRGER
jgi:hypothetical protein